MISLKDLYNVLTAVTPLYVAMFVAYISVKCKIFSPDQCLGVNKFVSVFAVPILSFEVIRRINPYTMNLRFFAADLVSKTISLFCLMVWAKFTKSGNLDWTITAFSLSALPNTLVMGIPLLKGMYGDFTETLMVQTVVMQCLLWYTLLLFLYEYRSARILIHERFAESGSSIASVKIQPDVVSLDERELLQTFSHVDQDGKIHVRVGKSTDMSSVASSQRYQSARNSMNSVQTSSSRFLGDSSFSQAECFNSFHSDPEAQLPRMANWDEEILRTSNCGGDSGLSTEREQQKQGNHEQGCDSNVVGFHGNGDTVPASDGVIDSKISVENAANEVHLFVWSSGDSPISDAGIYCLSGSASEYGGSSRTNRDRLRRGQPHINHNIAPNGLSKSAESCAKGDTNMDASGSGCREGTAEVPSDHSKAAKKSSCVSALVMINLISNMVWRKLIRNPNIHASILGLSWSLAAYRWDFVMPAMLEGSVTILSNAGLGMAMFSLGLFMALKPKIIACGWKLALLGMVLRFLIGPATMVVGSLVLGLRHRILHVAIVQAALPQGIVPFIFARDYNLHADVLSTGVIFGMIVSLPVTLLYYVLLGL